MRYLAVDFGPQKIRVNAISAGPIRTLAGAGITTRATCSPSSRRHSPLARGVTLEELGGAGLYLLSDLSTGVTGEIHFVEFRLQRHRHAASRRLARRSCARRRLRAPHVLAPRRDKSVDGRVKPGQARP